MKKTLLFITGLILGIILFMPKENLFFTAQHYLKNQNLFINFQTINSSLFKLKLENVNIYYKGIDGVNIKQINILPLLFINKIYLKNINIFNNNANIEITYNIFSPFKMDIKGSSNFGEIKGDINLNKKHLKVYILNLKNDKLKTFLKHNQKGYFYEQSF